MKRGGGGGLILKGALVAFSKCKTFNTYNLGTSRLKKSNYRYLTKSVLDDEDSGLLKKVAQGAMATSMVLSVSFSMKILSCL